MKQKIKGLQAALLLALVVLGSGCVHRGDMASSLRAVRGPESAHEVVRGDPEVWPPPGAPPGAGSKFRHLHPWFRGPDPETTSRLTE